MNSRRPFARTATDLSLLRPQSLPGDTDIQGQPTRDHTSAGIAPRNAISNTPVQVHVVPYLTPYKVAILVLIEYYCQDRCLQSKAKDLLLFLLQCIQDPSEYLQPGLAAFSSKVTTEVGPEAWGHLQDTLKRIKSPHHLSDFFISKLEPDERHLNSHVLRRIGLAGLIVHRTDVMNDNVEKGLDPGSVLGLYIRKAQIEYKKLMFEDMCKLYMAFESYIAHLDKEKNTNRDLSKGDTYVNSTFDAEKYLDLQAQELSNPTHIQVPEELMAHVHSIKTRMPSLAKTHYITCLHAQQTGDFEVAVQSLHRFFDYCMSMDDRALYQYALLNLAMLHARFCHFDQALLAIRETIEVARDNQDQECLSYALSWLNRLSRSNTATESSEAQILANMANKMDVQVFQYLHSLSELTITRQQQGESMSKALEALVKSASINLRHSLDGVGGAVQLLQSRVWGAYGSPSLSSLYTQLHLRYRPTESDMNDAASSLAKHSSDLALHGHYLTSLAVLEEAKKTFPLSTMKATPWIQTLVQTLQRRAMACGHVRDAELWTDQLGTTLVNTTFPTANAGTVSPSRQSQLDDTNLEIQLEILLQRALLRVLVGQRLSGAKQLSEGLGVLRQNQWPGTHKFTIMYLLSLAEIYMESGSAMSAIPLLLTATTLSENNLQKPLLFLVKLRTAEVLLSLDSSQQAIELVEGIMVSVLNQGDAFTQALAHFQVAKCLLAQANKFMVNSKSSHPLSKQHRMALLQAADALKNALQGFQQVESLKDVLQVLYFQVRTFRELGQKEDMERALGLFRRTSDKLSMARNQQGPSWYAYYYTRDAFDGLLRPEKTEKADVQAESAFGKAAKKTGRVWDIQGQESRQATEEDHAMVAGGGEADMDLEVGTTGEASNGFGLGLAHEDTDPESGQTAKKRRIASEAPPRA